MTPRNTQSPTSPRHRFPGESRPRQRTDRGHCAANALRLDLGAPRPTEAGTTLGPPGLACKIDRSGTSASAEPIRFGVVIPVHDEEQLISVALDSVGGAMSRVSDGGVTVGIAVVLDRCSDRSGERVAEWRHRAAASDAAGPIEILEMDAGNVGLARKVGCQALLHRWSDSAPEDIWLATTDADSEVPPNWISAQLRARREGGQVWAGAVSVRDWSSRALGTAEAWFRQYEAEPLPIHGANFGIDAATYLEAGGFEALPTGEDRELFEKAVALGAVIRHDPLVRVVTSGRPDARAPRGFAHALTSIEATIATLAKIDQVEVPT